MRTITNPEKTIREIEEIFQWRRDRQEDWSAHHWYGEDPLIIQTKLDAEAYQRIKNLFD